MKLKKRKLPRIQWGCIWCGGSPRTAEHLWPEWFSKLVPKSRQSHDNLKMRVRYNLPAAVILAPEVRKRPGDPASLTLKVVCEPCNNVWMGRVEEAAKRVMTPLILGHPAILTPDDQRCIVEWLALKSMIGEYDDSPDTRAIDKEMQRAFYERRELLGTWKVWIGRYQGTEWITRYRHAPAFVGSRSANPAVAAGVVNPPRVNTQISTFVGGQFYMQVMSSRSPLTEGFGFQGGTGRMLRQIWPALTHNIVWPPDAVMTDGDADFVANALGFWGGRPQPS